MNIYNKNKYIRNSNINIIIAILYKIILIAIYFYLTQGVLLCEDGPNTKEWGQDWNKPVVTEDTPCNNEDGGNNNQYMPYRPGLQSTSQGYRYEADGKSVNYQLTKEGYRTEVEGRPVNYHPNSYDSSRRVNLNEMYSKKNETYNTSDNLSYSSKIVVNSEGNTVINGNSTIRYEMEGNPINHDPIIIQSGNRTTCAYYYGVDTNTGLAVYSYQNVDNGSIVYVSSTQLGIIEPTSSQMAKYARDGYNAQAVYPIDLYRSNSNPSLGKMACKKIFYGIKNHIDKSSDESIRVSRAQSEKYAKNIHRMKSMERARRNQHTMDMLRYRNK